MLKTERDEILGARIGPARNAARRILKLAKVTEPPVFINQIIPILKEEYNLDAVKGVPLSDHFSGFLIQENNLSAIAYNDTQHVHRQRFTVAHEIGHLVMGHNVIDEGSVTQTEEKEANVFAAELLMPLELLKKDLKRGGCNVDSLAEAYWVSKQAMGHRFQDPAVLRCVK